ncbi:MAG: hypothetical protein FJ014_19285 [Chloroflexi bacterium]|nr:hypothetical protein [Chloroflexota bacterium]
MHDIEVDQSGRTDRLTVNTVLAFSDGIRSAILIPSAVKRACYQHLRAQGVRSHRIGVKLLIAGLVLLLQNHIKTVELVAIDREYVGGAEGDIKGELLQRLRQQAPDLHSDQIVFRQIGKKSAAHKLALEIYRGEREPDRRISTEELLGALR